MDRYDDFFGPAMKLLGYDSLFSPKHDAPGHMFGFYTDGTAIFWRENFVAEEKLVGNHIDDEVVVHALVRLSNTPFGNMLFASTHLKAKPGEKAEARRTNQIGKLLDVMAIHKKEGDRVVLCGDFNTDPIDTAAHKAQAVPSVLKHELGLVSVYPFDTPYTTIKSRRGELIKHCIDYIFLGDGLEPVGRWEIPDIKPPGLPALNYPSDHISIGVKLRTSNI